MIIDTNLEAIKQYLNLKIGGLFDMFGELFSFTKRKFDKLDTFYLKVAEFDNVTKSIESDVNGIEEEVNKKGSDNIKLLFKKLISLLLIINFTAFIINLYTLVKSNSKKEIIDSMENDNLKFIEKIKSVIND